MLFSMYMLDVFVKCFHENAARCPLRLPSEVLERLVNRPGSGHVLTR